MNIILIGAGNLMYSLAPALQHAGVNIIQVYSRTEDHASELARKLNVPFTTDLNEIEINADIYFFSLKDSILLEVAKQIKPNNALWIHTSGSIPLSSFIETHNRAGVFYPLQTFTHGREVNFEDIPIFIEANKEEDLLLLKKLGCALSPNVIELNSEKRKWLHLAAVFACNFTNHCYAIAANILEQQNLNYQYLLPLINETTNKIHNLHPKEAQTGPAIRYDTNVINKHLAMLSDPNLKELYTLLSKNINKYSTNE